MAKILNEALLFKLSPSVRPDPLALADRDRREELREQQSLTAAFFGDPLPGMSALDRRRRNEVVKLGVVDMITPAMNRSRFCDTRAISHPSSHNRKPETYFGFNSALNRNRN
jgi:hypothetical protein